MLHQITKKMLQQQIIFKTNAVLKEKYLSL